MSLNQGSIFTSSVIKFSIFVMTVQLRQTEQKVILTSFQHLHSQAYCWWLHKILPGSSLKAKYRLKSRPYSIQQKLHCSAASVQNSHTSQYATFEVAVGQLFFVHMYVYKIQIFLWDTGLSQQWLQRSLASGMWCHAVWKKLFQNTS